MKALLVWHEAQTLQVARRLLQNKGYDVWRCDDSRCGALLVKQLEPNLVVAQLMMPHLDGIELLREIRRVPIEDGPKVFLATAKWREMATDSRIKADGYVDNPPTWDVWQTLPEAGRGPDGWQD